MNGLRNNKLKTKICGKCGELKPLSKFNKNKYGKHGIRSKCKKCDHAYHTEWYANNKKDKLKYNKEYDAKHKDVRTKYLKEYNKRWAKQNQDKRNITRAKYKAKKLKLTPELSDEETRKLELIYSKKHDLGSEWHVDHIIPLSKGGLHHPDNLQIIPKTENLRKKDRLNYEVPEHLIIKLEEEDG